MSQITDALAITKAALDRATTALAGVQADVTSLKAKIEALNSSSSSTLSPEDQAALADIQSVANAIADKAQSLDAQTDEAPADEGAEPTPGSL